MKSSQSILIAERCTITQNWLCDVLTKSFSFHRDQIFISNDIESVINVISEIDIYLVVMDVLQSEFCGIEIFSKLKRNGFKGKVLFLSSGKNNSSESYIVRKLGANGYISKNETTENIKTTLKSVLSGYTVFKNDNNKTLSILSKKEIIVYNYLIQGLTNKTIANILCISPKTVSTYKNRILTKLGVKTVLELYRLNLKFN